MPSRVIILVANGFQDEEFVYPYYRLKEAGAEVEIGALTGVMRTEKGATYDFKKYSMRDTIKKYSMRDTIESQLLRREGWDGVIIPGGFESPDRLRCEPLVLEFVQAMTGRGRLVASICHGPWVLISANVVRGRHVTGYKSIRADLENAGALYEEKPVVIDGNLITAPHYHQLPEFMHAVVTWLDERQRP